MSPKRHIWRFFSSHCVSASASQSRAQCCARELGCKILFLDVHPAAPQPGAQSSRRLASAATDAPSTDAPSPSTPPPAPGSSTSPGSGRYSTLLYTILYGNTQRELSSDYR